MPKVLSACLGSRSLRPVICVAVALALNACTIIRDTQPARSATEEMLISTAAERVSDRMQLDFAHGAKVFVDPADFEGYDSKYALGTFKDRLLRRGALLVSDKNQADFVIAPRSGALSNNQRDFLIGIPSVTLPVPLTGPVTTPELALYKRELEQGVAKVAVTAYDAKTGALRQSLDPEYGYSDRKRWLVLFVISWRRDDLMPDAKRDKEE